VSNILITGGAGFIGSHLTKKLIDLGHNVTVLDDMTTGTADNLPFLAADAIYTGTVANYAFVNDLAAGQEIIFHLAARNIIASTKSPRDDLETNITGTLNVLLAAREHGVRRVVYAGSASVYGNSRHLPICEDETIDLLTPYAVSKYTGEGYCQAFFESYDLPVTILRYSNVYGPHQHIGVVPFFFEAAGRQTNMKIHGDGCQTRDFTYVDDAVDLTILAAQSPRAVGEIFNVGTGRETSVNDLARLIMKIHDLKAEPYHIDRRDIDNIRRRVLNVEKARRVLRWIPAFSLKKGLQLTYDLARH
jgi:UDP-glucose 4-epimerase